MASSHDTLISCRKCRKQYPMGDMLYNGNGKDLICGRCAGREVASSAQTQLKEEEKQKYYCISCRYSFMRSKEKVVDACPYCNKPTVRKFEAKTTDELLEDAEYPFD